MYQAIETKFIGPTNHRGSRVVASAEAGRVTVGWDYALSPEQNHVAAAKALASKYGWQGEWIGGGNAKGTGYCFTSLRRERDGGCTNLTNGAFQVTESEVAK